MFLKPRTKTELPTIVGKDTQFTGDIISSGEVQIDGEVIGDIHALVLKIHPNASVKGSITAEQIEHHGKIIGNVQTNHIHLTKDSRIEGDVLHCHITIESGAFINGICQHITPEIFESARSAGQGKNENENEKIVAMPQAKTLSS